MAKVTPNLLYSLGSFLLLKLIFINATFFSYSEETQEECSQLLWDNDNKLKWSDFKGVPDSTLLIFGTLPDAVSIVFIEITIDSSNNYKALAKFNQCKSWVRVKSEEILVHEIGHFMIEELFARDLQSVLDQNQENFDLNIDSLFQVTLHRSAEAHKQYDSRTLFGTLENAQKIWIDSLSHELKY